MILTYVMNENVRCDKTLARATSFIYTSIEEHLTNEGKANFLKKGKIKHAKKSELL